ncbi:dihydroorotase [Methylacidiphilum caldifontis]|uniref:Dihydroorotase n=1 Tax=Methylacidiphilum caldifontis TaxID=2795386 RepID=A0A4Y8P8L1_9BACT|nr:dihydroorotase [Methylacidiphilum caldifontis]TFE66545.1 dihydroorotase [Methylacidiphilum caldifontis]
MDNKKTGFHISSGRLIDPLSCRDEIGDLYVAGGKIVDPTDFPADFQWLRIDAQGLIIAPGLIDMHVHLREPGETRKETIRTGTLAAAAGGITTVVAMPNTIPPTDNPDTITWIRKKAEKEAVVKVYPTGCITEGRRGEKLSPFQSLVQAGAIALSDDGNCVQNSRMMYLAMEFASILNVPILDHCEDTALSNGGVMNEGYWSTLLGLPGWPSVAEEIMVSRDILLCEKTQARIHLQHLTTEGSVRLLREAKKRGIPISAEVCPHHIALTESALRDYDTRFKMNPPLRGQKDREALIEAIVDGTIEVIASDHAPHTVFEKEVEFEKAPFGVVGLETLLAVCLKELYFSKKMSLLDLFSRLTLGPSRVLGLPQPSLDYGSSADLILLDLGAEWTVEASQFLSKGRNTPFEGLSLKGKVVLTMVEGQIVWKMEGKDLVVK